MGAGHQQRPLAKGLEATKPTSWGSAAQQGSQLHFLIAFYLLLFTDTHLAFLSIESLLMSTLESLMDKAARLAGLSVSFFCSAMAQGCFVSAQ